MKQLSTDEKLIVLGVRLKTIKNIANALNVNENKILILDKD